MLTITMTCPLPNGIHARPASELELITGQFKSDITLKNIDKQTQANAKSVLSMISADVSFGDKCELSISGEDEEQAYQILSEFIDNKLAHIDAPLESVAINHTSPLPVFLAQAKPTHRRGKGVSKGIGSGTPIIADSIDLFELAAKEPESTAQEIEHSLTLSRQNVIAQLNQTLKNAESEAKTVLQAQLKILEDNTFYDSLFNQPEAKNAPHAVALTCHALSQSLKASSNRYLQERALDIHDICLRYVSSLINRPIDNEIKLTGDSILVSNGLLTPSKLLSLAGNKLKGIVMGEGGDTSHTVILARSFGIPVVTGIENAVEFVQGQKEAIVDANNGIVVISPNEQTQQYYRLENHKLAQIARRLTQYSNKRVSTTDRVQIDVSANIAIAQEGNIAFSAGADGIGLFRTEMIFCERTHAPEEEEQFQTYKSVLVAMQGKKVVIRTLDIGGDKPCEYLGLPEEENPFLGYRAIRIYPEYMSIFRTQVRALLRASHYGELHVMVPMVSTIEEVKWLNEQFNLIHTELVAENHPIGNWHLGIMVEVPSAMYILEKAAQWIDFISIGSNDLTQYFFACDRGNKQVGYLYDYLTPSFLALLHDIVSRATNAGLSVSLCGEMAADVNALPLLIGLGLNQLSMSMTAIPKTKETITTLNYADCRTLFNQAINADNSAQVKTLLADFEKTLQIKPVLCADLIQLDVDIHSKAEAIKRLTDNLEINQRVSSGADIEHAIWAREAVFSTALGFSVAIPHCKSDCVIHNSISMLRLAQPINWSDDVDVSIVFMLTVCEQDGQNSHMHLFSKLARKLMHADFRNSLSEQSDINDILHLLESELSG